MVGAAFGENLRAVRIFMTHHKHRLQLPVIRHREKERHTFWALASQSRRIWYGEGFALAGLTLLGIIGVNALQGQRYSLSDKFLTGEAGLVLLFGAAVFCWGANQVHGWQRMRVHGKAADATVTKVKLSWFQPDVGRTLFLKRPKVSLGVVHYRYQDPMGTIHQGRSGLLGIGPGAEFQAGEPARILFDPENPGRSMWVGKEQGAGGTPTSDAPHYPEIPARARTHST